MLTYRLMGFRALTFSFSFFVNAFAHQIHFTGARSIPSVINRGQILFRPRPDSFVRCIQGWKPNMPPKGKAKQAKKVKEADTKPDADEVQDPVKKTKHSAGKKNDSSSDDNKREQARQAKSSSKATKDAASDEQFAEVSSSSEKSEGTVNENKAVSSKQSKKSGRSVKGSDKQEKEQSSSKEVAKHDISDDSESDDNGQNNGKDAANASRKRGRQGADKASDKPSNKKAKTDLPEAKGDSKPMLNRTTSDFEGIKFDSTAQTKDGKDWNFKISSWNVAGLKAWIKKNGLDFIKHENPDIICLQETKCSEKKLPPEAKVKGYHTYWLSGDKEGYAGLALLSKEKPISVKYGIGNKEFDCDGRLITAEFEKFYLVAVYVPNAGQKLKTLPRRMEWDPLFRSHLKKLDEEKPVILCGDMNVAHDAIDLANPKTNTKNAGFTQEERDGLTALLKEGFVDTFRHLYPDKTGAYTFWTYMGNARSRNTGWRLDYFILSERLLPSMCDNVIRNEVYGSDHCPITLLIHI